MKFFIIYLFICFMITSCSAVHEEGSFASRQSIDELVNQKLQKPNEIYYKDIYQLVLKNSCIECHSPNNKKAGIDLSTHRASLDGAVTPFSPNSSSMYKTIILKSGSLKMPPTNRKPLTESQKNLIFQWINAGAQGVDNNTPQRPKTPSELLEPYFKNPETIDYNLVKAQVFEKNCMSCHSTDGQKTDQDGAIQYGQDMSDYESLFTGNGVVADQLTDYVINVDGQLKKKKGSRIYKSIAVSMTMPPSKDGYEPLDSNLIKLVRLWIKNCAIEDYSQVKNQDQILDPESSKRKNGKVRDCSL